ncbi:MAG: hypothetical protein HGA87_02765 [Desulfobulbaceae bacterium]|nr:hypothetical protein [Desulfobulbaceae bacterium]
MCNIHQVNDPFWKEVVSDPKIIISAAAVLVNVGLAVLNYLLLLRNISNERVYKADFTFYQLLVLNTSKELIAFSAETNKIYTELKIKNSRVAESEYLKIVQDSLDALERKYDQVRIEMLPLLKGFSPELGAEVSKVLEILQDNSQDLFTKFATNKPTASSIQIIDAKFSKNLETFLDHLMQIVKKFCPGHK